MNTTQRIARSKSIFDDKTVALEWLDCEFNHIPGQFVAARYYSDVKIDLNSRGSEIRSIVSLGMKSGIGRECHQIISTKDIITVDSILSELPDVSELYKTKTYLVKEDDTYYLYYYNTSIDARDRVEVTGPRIFENLEDGTTAYLGKDNILRLDIDFITINDVLNSEALKDYIASEIAKAQLGGEGTDLSDDKIKELLSFILKDQQHNTIGGDLEGHSGYKHLISEIFDLPSELSSIKSRLNALENATPEVVVTLFGKLEYPTTIAAKPSGSIVPVSLPALLENGEEVTTGVTKSFTCEGLDIDIPSTGILTIPENKTKSTKTFTIKAEYIYTKGSESDAVTYPTNEVTITQNAATIIETGTITYATAAATSGSKATCSTKTFGVKINNTLQENIDWKFSIKNESDKSIASINETTGEVTFLSENPSTSAAREITVVYKGTDVNGDVHSKEVKVSQAKTVIAKTGSLSYGSADFSAAGETRIYDSIPKITKNGIEQTVTWTFSVGESTIASIDDSGKLTFLKSFSTTRRSVVVTATCEYSGQTYTVTSTVYQKAAVFNVSGTLTYNYGDTEENLVPAEGGTAFATWKNYLITKDGEDISVFTDVEYSISGAPEGYSIDSDGDVTFRKNESTTDRVRILVTATIYYDELILGTKSVYISQEVAEEIAGNIYISSGSTEYTADNLKEFLIQIQTLLVQILILIQMNSHSLSQANEVPTLQFLPLLIIKLHIFQQLC